MWRSLVITFAALALTACFGGGGGGASQGAMGTDPSVAARTSVLPPGDPDCAYGGVLVETGIDENGNGVLDADEVDESEKVCNGAPGANGSDGLSVLININTEPAGANCPQGGVRIDTGIDDNGNGVLEPGEIDQTGFACNGTDGAVGWQIPTVIDRLDSSVSTSGVDIAMDASGNAIAVWAQNTGSHVAILSSRYLAGVGWGEPEAIDEVGSTEESALPQIAMDAEGNALAVWVQFGSTYTNVWGNHYTAGVGWDGAVLLESSDTAMDYVNLPPKLAMTNGNGVVVWGQRNGVGRLEVYAKQYHQKAFVKWGTNAALSDAAAGDTYNPQVAMDDTGNIMVMWAQDTGTDASIWSNRFAAGASVWDGPLPIVQGITVGLRNFDLAMDAVGNAQAVWTQEIGTSNVYDIQGSRYLAGSGWQAPEILDTEAGDAVQPQVVMDPAGNTMLVWAQSDGTRYNIWARRYDVITATWEDGQLIETDNLADAVGPRVAMDASGNAMAVWGQAGFLATTIRSNNYRAGIGWGVAELVETGTDRSAGGAEMAMDANGNVTAVWFQEDSSATRYDLWANRWGAP
ncbi:MAG TPA: hypothetical protein ENI97_12725 [Gammaproteobacteria bacterium]|nr:hypothetical protein [Gammaproteobacteria bacterium]